MSLGSQTGSGFKSEFPLQAAPQGNGSSITRNNEREKQHHPHGGDGGLRSSGFSGSRVLQPSDSPCSKPRDQICCRPRRIYSQFSKLYHGTPVLRFSDSPALRALGALRALRALQALWLSNSPPLRLAGFPVQWNSLEFLCCRSYCQTSAFSFVLSWT